MSEVEQLKGLMQVSDNDLRKLWLKNELERIDREHGPSWYRHDAWSWGAVIWLSAVACSIFFLLLGINVLSLALTAGVSLSLIALYSYGWPKWRKLRSQAIKASKTLDVSDPANTLFLIQAVCQPAIRYASDLKRSVDADIRQIRHAQEDMERMQRELSGGLQHSSSDYARDLMQSRSHDVDRAISSLEQLHTQLVNQRTLINEAIEPVEQLNSKFKEIWGVANQISRLQTAYQIGDETIKRMEIRREEIDKLYALTDHTEIRLRELAASIESERRARAEVRELIQQAIDSPK